MGAEPAREALGELMNASLVDYEQERYRLHDLARVFADSRYPDAEKHAARGGAPRPDRVGRGPAVATGFAPPPARSFALAQDDNAGRGLRLGGRLRCASRRVGTLLARAPR